MTPSWSRDSVVGKDSDNTTGRTAEKTWFSSRWGQDKFVSCLISPYRL